MRILFAGNFNITAGTGYSTIIKHLGLGLTDRFHEVWVLGEHWSRAEHNLPFTVIPSDYNWIPAQAVRLQEVMVFDHIILAMDAPKIANMIASSKAWLEWKAPTSAIFAIESEPVLPIWAERLARLHTRFVISQYGQSVLDRDTGIDSVWLPVTAEIPQTTVRWEDARAQLKEFIQMGNPGILDRAGPLLVTVADNQERKDLPTIANAVKTLHDQGVDVGWLLLTATRSPYGWHFPQLLLQTGIEEHTAVINWGVPAHLLDLVYWAADCLVLASQAEGACLPIFEAMARGIPTVAPDHTAITEALSAGRGILVKPIRTSIHPFGNCTRYHVTPEDLADGILDAHLVNSKPLVDFINSRPWSDSARILEDALYVEKTQKSQTSPPILEGAMATTARFVSAD